MSSVPVLLIVMGTSGSGKSTVGSALAQSLHCPFVDGDDLHPASNVAKMSAGHPLNDTDREPWLRTIRETGRTLALTQTQPQLAPAKKLAEVYETSHQTRTSTDEAVETTAHVPDEHTKGAKVAVIACSALKLVYRRLLRGSIQSLDDPAATAQEHVQYKDLRTVHVYLNLSRELLEHRMAARKGHFMKLDMLYSQLDTLQKPTPQEPDVIIVDVQPDTSTEAIIAQTVAQLRSQAII